MIKHMIMWQFKDQVEDLESHKKEIKAALEGLQGKIEGLQSIAVIIDGLDSSNADILLDSTLDDSAALKRYADFPEHAAIAREKIIPFMKTRTCMDFEQ